MKLIFLLILPFFFAVSHAQEDLADVYKELYKQDKYDEIINYKVESLGDLSGKALYYRGMAHYMKSEDDDAMKYLDLAINVGPVDGDMYFYKAMLLYFQTRFTESLPYFDLAIAKLSTEPDFLAGKGEAYYSMEMLDSAIVYFEKASILPHCEPRVFLLMGEIYQEKSDLKHAIVAYQSAYELLDATDPSHQNCSYNLGLTLSMNENFSDAITILEMHETIYPSDFHAMSKLIQAYYGMSEFEKAKPLKEKLYAAHKENKLETGLSEIFCFDQFIWKDHRVMAFEVFDETDDFLFIKHHFYVLDDKGEIAYQVDSESSAAVRMIGPESKYVLCLKRNQSYFTFWQYVFNDDYEYPELKTAVLNILNEKVKPSSSTTPVKKH